MTYESPRQSQQHDKWATHQDNPAQHGENIAKNLVLLCPKTKQENNHPKKTEQPARFSSDEPSENTRHQTLPCFAALSLFYTVFTLPHY